MAGKIRIHIRSNLYGLIAIFIALGGTTYAATKLPKNSVGPKQIKANAVGTSEAKDNGLTGQDVNEATLGQVPTAQSAVGAQTATSAQNADLLDGLDSTDFLGSNGKAADADRLDGMDSSAFAGVGSEDWHEVGSPGEPSFNDPAGSCRWENNPLLTDRNTVAFQRDGFGFVHLKGLVRHDGCLFGFGSESNIFQLPVGYTPAKAEVNVTLTADGTLARIDVRPDGWVLPEPPTNQSNAGVWISLDGITFRCAPSGSNGCP